MRLVAASLAGISLLTACSSSDIVVKTDLDEEYIVKESAVSIIPFNWEKKIDAQKNDVKEWDDLVKQWGKIVRDCNISLGESHELCIESVNDQSDSKEELDKSRTRLDELKSFKVKDEDDNKIISAVRYRAIFKDINGDKVAQSYATATCLNPKSIGSEESEKLFDLLNLNIDDTEKKRSAKESAYLTVTKEVCSKHAFADTVFFNYEIDKDQDKDKKD